MASFGVRLAAVASGGAGNGGERLRTDARSGLLLAETVRAPGAGAWPRSAMEPRSQRLERGGGIRKSPGASANSGGRRRPAALAGRRWIAGGDLDCARRMFRDSNLRKPPRQDRLIFLPQRKKLGQNYGLTTRVQTITYVT